MIVNTALFLEAQRQRLSRLNDDFVDRRIASQVIPALPGRPEQEAQIVALRSVLRCSTRRE